MLVVNSLLPGVSRNSIEFCIYREFELCMMSTYSLAFVASSSNHLNM